MKNLQLNAWERVMLSQTLPQGTTLLQVSDFLRILEILRLKEDERRSVGWQEDRQKGSVVIKDVVSETEISFEDADFEILRDCAMRWDRWPVALQTAVLRGKLDAD
jgi:hypothetical protein